eukprot:scaffold927_cov135-Isochrysis_galbana.AAC.2
MVTYIYLEKDWSTKDGETAGLLEAFVRFVISPEGQALAVENLFVPMPQALIDLANSALDAVIFPDDMVRFVRETSTLGEAGTQDYVISDKRQSYADYERKELIQALAETRATQATLMSTISAIGSQSAFEVHGSGTTNPSCSCRASVPLPPAALAPPHSCARAGPLAFPVHPMRPSHSNARSAGSGKSSTSSRRAPRSGST